MGPHRSLIAGVGPKRLNALDVSTLGHTGISLFRIRLINPAHLGAIPYSSDRPWGMSPLMVLLSTNGRRRLIVSEAFSTRSTCRLSGRCDDHPTGICRGLMRSCVEAKRGLADRESEKHREPSVSGGAADWVGAGSTGIEG